MRILKLYGGIILILVSVVILALTFFNIVELEKEVYNHTLEACGVMIVLGVVLSCVAGKSADKIGGE
ncbi:MAG: hypothetical protein Q4B58_08545 [Bacteroidales bacterium]|nr:hypothetical protein [Bacteroidales bacterium]